MDDLVTWLRAQIDEDERVARAPIYDNATGRWYVQAEAGYLHEAVTDETGLRLATGSREVNAYAAHFDPARVLREVEAKRRIVDDALEATRATGATWLLAERTLRHLAAGYSDRPGYRDEWRP